MPSNIFAKSGKDNKIFKDERFLYPEFVPELLPHRESQINELVNALQPVLNGLKPHNVFVFGPTGTGKTVSVKYVLNQLEEFSNRAKSLYLNCFESNTRHAVLGEISNFLGNPVPRRGIATDEMYSEVVSAMKKIDFIPIIVLDEFDQLLKDNQGSLLLYDLLRIIHHQKKTFALVLISNDSFLLSKLDDRVKSSLQQDSVEFAQYTPKQLKDILKERAKYAFNENSLGADVINLAAAFAAKNKGDARIALEALWKAGGIAESNNAKKVTIEMLREAFNSIESRFVQKSKNFLDEHEKIILEILLKKDKINSGDLFKQYIKTAKEPVSERSFRKKINSLETKNLILAKYLSKGMRGSTREISLADDKDKIKQALK